MNEFKILELECPHCEGHGYSSVSWPVMSNLIFVKVSCEFCQKRWIQIIQNGRHCEERISDYIVDPADVPAFTQTQVDALKEELGCPLVRTS